MENQNKHRTKTRIKQHQTKNDKEENSNET
jgi:hypothetical protein